jgi:hypothetical protein
MKKIILTVIIGLAGLMTHAQYTSDTLSVDKPGAGYSVTSIERLTENDLKTPELRMYYSGLEMKTFAKHHSRGMALLTIGAGLIIGGPVYNAINDGDFNNAYNLVRIGGLMSIIGTVLEFEASTHMRDAGLILSGNGVGIRVKINK